MDVADHRDFDPSGGGREEATHLLHLHPEGPSTADAEQATSHADERLFAKAVNRDDRAMPDTTQPPQDLRPYLLDLERPFDPRADRLYDAVELVRFALTIGTDHWPGLALNWLDQGVPTADLAEELAAFEQERRRPQAQRHQARRLRKASQG
jgi:hypothetical protein